MDQGGTRIAELLASRNIERPRSEIEASWRRSLRLGLSPDRLTRRSQQLETHTPLVRAATPILQQLASYLGPVDSSLILTDALAQVLLRFDVAKGIRGTLDAACLGPGADFSEDLVGTNAIGTALVVRRPIAVFGNEHFADELSGLSCAAALVRDPASGDVLGVVDVSSKPGDASSLMLGVARAAAKRIEDALGNALPVGTKRVRDLLRSWHTLTASERRVAVLAGRGFTNREIADQLMISRFTVDSHLRVIFGKLGVNTRSGLAFLVAQRAQERGD